MAKVYSTSQVADILGVTNSKLYYAIREMSLNIDTDHRGDRLFSDEDISLLKQAFAIVESGGTYKQAYNHLVKGEVIEVDHTPIKQQLDSEGVKELLKAISQEMANNNKDVQEQTIKAISENTQSTKEMAQVMQELKDEIQALKQELAEMKAEPPEPEQKQGFFSKLFGKK